MRAPRRARRCGRSTRTRAPRSSCRSATSTCRPCSAASRRRSIRCVATGESAAFRRLRPQRHLRPGHPRRRARRLERARRPHRRRSRAATARRCACTTAGASAATKRKAGNVADFCRRWGAAYRYFVVLDADSVMTGECLTTLVRHDGSASRRRHHPDRAARGRPRDAARPRPAVLRRAPTGRCSPPACASGSSASRTTGATTRSCAWRRSSPTARWRRCAGAGSLSGDILSHDFVEAALMRRAGWKVWVADELDGSYEQVPPNLLAELQRDRRWCHGNLQNSRLMFEPRPARGAPHRLPDRRARLRLVAALARLPAALDPAVRAATPAAIRPTSSSRTSCSRSGRPPTSS